MRQLLCGIFKRATVAQQIGRGKVGHRTFSGLDILPQRRNPEFQPFCRLFHSVLTAFQLGLDIGIRNGVGQNARQIGVAGFGADGDDKRDVFVEYPQAVTDFLHQQGVLQLIFAIRCQRRQRRGGTGRKARQHRLDTAQKGCRPQRGVKLRDRRFGQRTANLVEQNVGVQNLNLAIHDLFRRVHTGHDSF